jgi:hypothetical protein
MKVAQTRVVKVAFETSQEIGKKAKFVEDAKNDLQELELNIWRQQQKVTEQWASDVKGKVPYTVLK